MKLVKGLVIAFLLCLFVASAANVTDEPKKQKAKTVSLCEGCILGGVCVAEGVQKQEKVGGPLYYCGSDQEVGLVKDIGEVCTADYECEYYLCNDGYCDAKLEGEGTSNILISVFIGVMFILAIVVLFLFKFGASFKKISKEEKKMDQEQKKMPLWQTQIRGIKPGGPYKYRSEFDVLEKRMKEKLKK